MKLLLDTCTFLWAVSEPEKLSGSARSAILDPDNEVFVSAVTAWEIAVKHKLGSLMLASEPHIFVPTQREAHGFRTLPIEEDAVLQLGKLPDHHKDPFDRMLVCQSIWAGMALITPDPLISRYPVRTLW